jgi:hypothetical protein
MRSAARSGVGRAPKANASIRKKENKTTRRTYCGQNDIPNVLLDHAFGMMKIVP